MRKLIIATGMGFSLSENQEFEKLAKIGWDGVFTGWDEQNGNVETAKAIRDLGLYYQSIHAPFNKVNKLWLEGKDGDDEAERQINCLRAASEIGVDIVVTHTYIGFDDFTPTQLGVDRYGKIFTEAEKLGVKVALENTEGEPCLDKLLTTFKGNKFVGFCIDTGHEMCYNYSHDLITKYGSQLIATHLNDNMGITTDKIFWHDDAHLLPFDGIADWQGIANRLNAVGFDGPLTFELTSKSKPNRNTHDIYNGMDYDAFCTLAFEKAKKFRNMVENGKN